MSPRAASLEPTVNTRVRPWRGLFTIAFTTIAFVTITSTAICSVPAATWGQEVNTNSGVGNETTTGVAERSRPEMTAAAKRALTAADPTADDLRQIQEHLNKMALYCVPAVVAIRCNGGQGSGVIVSEDGLILTAAHVVEENGADATVILPDGREVEAKTLGSNHTIDSGMAKITAPGPWPYVDIGSSDKLQRNSWCFALGQPLGFRKHRSPPLRFGQVLDIDDFVIRSNCTIISGDSGGPLFGIDGHVVGIHSRIGSRLAQNLHVPVDTFSNTWDRLIAGETWGGQIGRQDTDPDSPILGVLLAAPAPGGQVVIQEVVADSGAGRAGVEVGDVITAVDGEEVSGRSEFLAKIQEHKAGDVIQVRLVRGNVSLQLDITLQRRGDR